MQAEKQKSWKICIHAKAKNFHFKIKVTNIIPTWELHHCSILLKLGKFLLRLKSEYGTPIIPSQPQRKTLKSKFFGFFKKFHFRRKKNQAIDLHPEAGNHLGWFAYKELICMCSSVVGILAFLAQTICNKEWRGIIIHGCVLMLYFALLLKKYMTRKISNFLVHLMGATAVCLLVFNLDNYLKYDFVQMPWNYVVSSSLPGIFQGFNNLLGSR